MKENFLDKTPKVLVSKVFFVVFLCAFIPMMLAYVIYLNFTFFSQVNVEELKSNNISIGYSIDSVKVENSYLYISGWAAELDEDITSVNTSILLLDPENSVYKKMKTRMVERTDVPDVLGIEYDIKNCGIEAVVRLDKLDSTKEYKVCILYSNNNSNDLIITDTCINTKGKIENG